MQTNLIALESPESPYSVFRSVDILSFVRDNVLNDI